jgi:hypothetical protein
MAALTNRDVADRLEESAYLLREQGADRFRCSQPPHADRSEGDA